MKILATIFILALLFDGYYLLATDKLQEALLVYILAVLVVIVEKLTDIKSLLKETK